MVFRRTNQNENLGCDQINIWGNLGKFHAFLSRRGNQQKKLYKSRIANSSVAVCSACISLLKSMWNSMGTSYALHKGHYYI